jgi:hypothetical protein
MRFQKCPDALALEHVVIDYDDADRLKVHACGFAWRAEICDRVMGCSSG